jgi:hypothetical protein
MTRGIRIGATTTLLAAGIGLFAYVQAHPSVARDAGARRPLGWLHVSVLMIAAALAAMPRPRRAIARLLERLRQPSPRARRITAAGVFVVAVLYILLTAWLQGRDLIPKFHDEHLMLLLTRLLAGGRLWTAPHPLADFFESFHIFVKPVYASVYFPGAAVVYAPGVWLGLKFWMVPLLVAGVGAAMTYLVVTDLIDGVAGLLAALMLVALQWFRYLAMMAMTQNVMLLLGLMFIASWLTWRRNKALRWAAAMGAFAGWAAITRPVDAIAYVAPVAAALLFELRALPLKRIAATVAAACLCATPFLSLQIIENVGVTGDPLRTPYRMYADLYTPQMSFGFHSFDPTVRPQTSLPQRQIYYDQFTVPAAQAHRPERLVHTWLHERLPLLAEVTLPNRLLLILLPLSALALATLPRVAAWGVLIAYVMLYALFAYLLPMYLVVVAPIAILWALLGKEAVERVLAPRAREVAAVGLTVALAGLAVAALPEVDHSFYDDGYPAPTMWFSYVELPGNVRPPAIVLFRFRPGDNVNEEPVYNIDVVNPDDAPIIRAHDLGVSRNRELFDYYAKRQPDRTVYLYDRASRTLVTLGNVVELARRFPVTRPMPS